MSGTPDLKIATGLKAGAQAGAQSMCARRFPGFIIAGAMKSGTSTLHRILAGHPDVYMPDKEIHYFDCDDIIQHPNFFRLEDEWHYVEFNDERLDRYCSNFSPATEGQLIGEDSTTYMTSAVAAQRISRINPKVKLIFMLRDPASRAYSHYWHSVRGGRAIWTFEKTLQYMPYNYISRGLYLSNIKTYLNFFKTGQMYFLVFEEFVKNQKRELNKLAEFLGIEPDRWQGVNIHINAARLPRFTGFHLFYNRLYRSRAKRHHTDISAAEGAGRKKTWVQKLYQRLNPLIVKQAPPMARATRDFLNRYFHEKNDGLSELVHKDLEVYWYK